MDTTTRSQPGAQADRTWRNRVVLVHLEGRSDALGRSWSLGLEESLVSREQDQPERPHELRIPGPSISRKPSVKLRFDPTLGVGFATQVPGAPPVLLNGRALAEAPVVVPSGSVLRVGGALLVFSAWQPSVPLLHASPPPDVSYASMLANELVSLASQRELPVLLLGPTGSGKERLAERYHQASRRRGRLVAVNCAGIAGDLLGSELFGHKKGAFSGAEEARAGLWASADGGTLFLDEVAELPAEQQSAVLRALDQKSVRPIGADEERGVDVRIISATSRDVDQLEADGVLRADFMARLAGLRIKVPALSDRREEILPLFRKFLDKRAPELTTEAAERLLLYEWPKNVRELGHAAKVAGMFAEVASAIGVELLPEAIRRHPIENVGGGPPARAELEALLLRHKGNIEQISEVFGVGRATVHRWLQKAQLDPKPFRKS